MVKEYVGSGVLLPFQFPTNLTCVVRVLLAKFLKCSVGLLITVMMVEAMVRREMVESEMNL